MTDCPCTSDFESFLRGTASSEVARIAVRHLLAVCRTCRATLIAMGWSPDRLERLVCLITNDPDDLSGEAPQAGYEYGESFAQACRACAREVLDQSRKASEPTAEEDTESLELDDLPVSAEDMVPDARLVMVFINRSLAARYQSPGKMLYWARLARVIAERCDNAPAGESQGVDDLRARAWGQLGNALRVSGRLRSAEQAMSRAEEYAAAGAGDLALRLDLLTYRASLATFERDFVRAIELLDEAGGIAREIGDQTRLAKCLLSKAIATVYLGEPQLAIGILDDAIRLLDNSDPHLLFAAFNNLGYCYLEAGRLQEALAVLPQTRELALQIGDDIHILRVTWQEAKILYELDLLEEAEAQFARARDGFIERDLAYEAAVVSLDLVAIYLRLGLTTEVRRTVADVLPFFKSLNVGRELMASLIQLQQAEDQTRALQLIRAISSELVALPKLPASI